MTVFHKHIISSSMGGGKTTYLLEKKNSLENIGCKVLYLDFNANGTKIRNIEEFKRVTNKLITSNRYDALMLDNTWCLEIDTFTAFLDSVDFLQIRREILNVYIAQDLTH